MSEEENLRKFLESDDPALVKMGISMAKGAGVEVTIKDLDHFLKRGNLETVKTGLMLADEAGIGDEAMEMLCEPLGDDNEHIRMKLNEIPMDNFLSDDGLSVRGSYEADKSQLYLGFYRQ